VDVAEEHVGVSDAGSAGCAAEHRHLRRVPAPFEELWEQSEQQKTIDTMQKRLEQLETKQQ
jgi:hypothetical protein